MRLQFAWNFSSWKTMLGSFSNPDIERRIDIDGTILNMQLRKEKSGSLVTMKFSSFTKSAYYSMSLTQLKMLRSIIDEFIDKGENSPDDEMEN